MMEGWREKRSGAVRRRSGFSIWDSGGTWVVDAPCDRSIIIDGFKKVLLGNRQNHMCEEMFL